MEYAYYITKEYVENLERHFQENPKEIFLSRTNSLEDRKKVYDPNNYYQGDRGSVPVVNFICSPCNNLINVITISQKPIVKCEKCGTRYENAY
jgi:hypothetical protein